MRFRGGLILLIVCASALSAAPVTPEAGNPLALQEIGQHSLKILSPTVLELTLVTGQQKSAESSHKGGFFSSLFGGGGGGGSTDLQEWNFDDEGKIPGPASFQVSAGGKTISVQRVGFRRRVLYAPIKKFDLRVGNSLLLELAGPIPSGAQVTVTNPDQKIWKPVREFKATMEEGRWSPAIHVNQMGYAPGLPKSAMIGYYLGSLGEMSLPSEAGFDLVDASTGKAVFHGKLPRRPDSGYTFTCYQEVCEADFSEFKTPGTYFVSVPGLGRSFPFVIDDGIPAAFARAYALGFYHQRCGGEDAMPFTRFTHKACHMAPAAIPTMQFKTVNYFLSKLAEENKDQRAPPLKDVDSSLFPFVNQGTVDVSGGHHDAGDYSKYTINSAQLIHFLVFAADAFPGVVELDNLGIPESGDGKSDILQEAKWEADFLAKMQDADGGFYFLVYPRERKYENDVLPDHGDPQLVAPKNTSATAAAVAALAQAATSPAFKKQFPAESALYLEKAKKGWAFLEKGWAKYGRDRCYQKLTHYGDVFDDQDEIAWAAVEIYLATGDEKVHQKLVEEFNPSDKKTWRWGWWSLFEGFGCAARSYGFAEKTGRVPPGKLNPALLNACNVELLARAHDCARDERNSAYGVSFPTPSKRFKNGGWFFPNDFGFDITVGYQLDPRPEFVEAVINNLNYEAGCNPVNVTFLTGMGTKRQREIVHQYAQNDGRVLPPSGIPLGSIQSGFAYVDPYKTMLKQLSFPSDDDPRNPYPFYDRWADTFNVQTEFTVQDLSRGLACLAFWMAQSPIKTQPWKSALAKIVDADHGFRLEAEGLDSKQASIVWEAEGQDPMIGPIFKPAKGARWIEAEALWPDGRRVFARREL